VEYREEEILNEIANSHPTKVVDFFGQRLAAERNSPEGDGFEAIPYEFYLLKPTLGWRQSFLPVATFILAGLEPSSLVHHRAA
jgi:hypothetical protein